MRRIQRIFLRHLIDAEARKLLTASGSPHGRGLPQGTARPWPPILALNNQTHEVRRFPNLDWYEGSP